MHAKSWTATVGIVVFLLQGCKRPIASGESCRWPSEASRQLDLTRNADRAHLTSDAAGAEDLAIRWADRHTGRLSGHFTSMPTYGVSRDSCMLALFTQVASLHGVTPSQVASLADRRPLGFDALIVGSLAVLCFGLLYVVGSEAFVRRITEESRALRVGVLMLAAPVVGLFWVGLGQFVSTTIESMRIRSSHLSNRALRLPFVAHEAALFVLGVVLFLATIAIRSWAFRRRGVR